MPKQLKRLVVIAFHVMAGGNTFRQSTSVLFSTGDGMSAANPASGWQGLTC
jgi:hypothetical protein